ncbi:4864_t:CDS:2, partial [Funneliformis mosseae]
FASLNLEFTNHARYTYIGDEPIVSSDTEFVIRKRNIFVLVVEESQIAVEILTFGSENIRLSKTPKDQTLWAIRKIEVKRLLIGNGLKTGFDLAEPAGRRIVLTALTKIRESLLKTTSNH